MGITRSRFAALALLTRLLLAAGVADAQDTEPPAPDRAVEQSHSVQEAQARGKPVSHVKRPPTIPAGLLQVFLPVQMSLTAGEVARPIFVGPNVTYGLSDTTSLRLLHSEAYRSPSAVAGLCLSGKGEGGCPALYNNVSADVVTTVYDGRTAGLAASAGASMSSLSPAHYGLMAGFVADLAVAKRVALQLDAQVMMALNARAAGNDDRLGSTARAFAQVDDRAVAFVLGGLFTSLSAWNQLLLPVGAGVIYAAYPKLDLGLQFTFTDLRGEKGAFAERQLSTLIAFRL